jgi:hypothetical protein
MARCKWCDRKGLFLFVTKDGICKNCSILINKEAQSRLRVISESKKIVEESINPATISGRTQTIIDHLDALQKFEDKGIQPLNFPILEILKDATYDNNEMITALFCDEYVHNKRKISKYKTEKSKVKALDKFISKANEFKAFLIEDATNYIECLKAIENIITKGDPSMILHYKQKQTRQRVYDYMNESEVELYAIIIAGSNSCEACKINDEKKYEIDQILTEFPIPEINCTHEYGCRCDVGYEYKYSIIDKYLYDSDID